MITWFSNARVYFVSVLSELSAGCLIQTQKGSIVIVLCYSSHCLARYLNVVLGMCMLNFEANIKTAILIIVIYMESEYEVEWRMTQFSTFMNLLYILVQLRLNKNGHSSKIIGFVKIPVHTLKQGFDHIVAEISLNIKFF